MDSLSNIPTPPSHHHRLQKSTASDQRIISSRNLISEYIAKTCPPPAILTPSNPTYELPSPDAQMELAYKHPQLLFDMEVEGDENGEETSYETNKEVEIKYINNSPGRQRWCLDSGRSNQCRLVGKVTPSIAKTWDQLSAAAAVTNAAGIGRNFSRSVSNNSDESEKILFYQPVLENEANFHVNKIIYSDDEDEYSCNFYDSIDDDTDQNDKNNNNNNNYDNIVSICCHQEAGEEMAEINSYERKKYHWSLDSEFK